jgi:uncharacterized membrane protein
MKISNLTIKSVNSDIIVYFWSSLFVIPVLFAVFFDDSSVRNLDYVLVILFLAYTYTNKLFSIIDTIVFSKKALMVFYTLALFAFIYSQLSQYYSFNINEIDHSIFDTMMQETIRGNIGFATSVNYYHFATHQNYILCLLLPIYALFPFTQTLLVMIATAMWLSGIFVWLICKKLNLNDLFSLLFVVYFYISPLNATQDGFMPELFYPLAVFILYHAYLKRGLLYFIISLLLFLSIKEDAPLYLLGFSAYLFIKKDFRFAIITILPTIAVIYINLHIVQPYFMLKSHMTQISTLDHWAMWGSTKEEIIHSYLTYPIKILSYSFNKSSGFWWLYSPVLFIPLLNPMVLLMSILPLILFLSSGPSIQGHILLNYYPIALNALVILGLIIFCAGKFARNYSKKLIALWGVLLIILTTPLWGGTELHFFHIDIKENKGFNQLYAKLQNDYKGKNICAGGNVYPHVLVREVHLMRYLGVVINLPYDQFLTYPNCVIVFENHDKNAPYDEYIEDMVSYAKNNPAICKNIGEFWYCDNYIANASKQKKLETR